MPHRVSTPGRPLIEVLRDLTSRIYSDFTYRSGSTTVSTQVSEVLAAREGVCQDFARLAIACLRANGLAASYVSGYLATDPPPGKERMVGIDATPRLGGGVDAAEPVAGLGPDQRPDGRRALHHGRLRAATTPTCRRCAASSTPTRKAA